MEGSRLTLVTLLCALLYISGEEVEMKVKPGENITLYCDLPVTHGFMLVWIRNSSHGNDSSIVLDFYQIDLEEFPHFSFIHNHHNNSVDLHIINISISDLGLYYCAKRENKVRTNEKGIIFSSKVYYYGNRTTRLSLAESTMASTPLPVSECVFCWTMMFSVCLLCVLLSSLLSSICVYCFCRPQTTGSEWSAEIFTADVIKREKHQCEASKTGKICIHTEVSYRRLTSHPNASI